MVCFCKIVIAGCNMILIVIITGIKDEIKLTFSMN